LKGSLKFENISGYTKIAVKQDFFSQTLAHNIIKDIENSSQKIKNLKNKKTQYKKKKEGKINTHMVI